MEKKLNKLFDYQRFEQNETLEKLIRETENRYAAELSDDDLSLVSAAGEVVACPETIDGNDIWGKDRILCTKLTTLQKGRYNTKETDKWKKKKRSKTGKWKMSPAACM